MIKVERICERCGVDFSCNVKSKCYVKLYAKHKFCRSCIKKNRWESLSEEEKNKIKATLDKNGKSRPFQGKKHTEESKQKLSKSNTGKVRSEEYKKHISHYMTINNPRKGGKNNYEVWIEKYGKEEADKRKVIFVEKQRILNSGSNNKMYGKPSPNGSGNGWKGWYKDIFFRSLLELAYLHYLFENNIEFKNGELIRIPYVSYDASDHTYSPDYIIDKVLVEIKPQRLIDNGQLVRIKKEAAEKWCLENGYEYKLICVEKLPLDLVIKLESDKSIVFTDKTKIKFEKYIKENHA